MKKTSTLFSSAAVTLSLVILLTSSSAFAQCPMKKEGTPCPCPCNKGKMMENREKMKEHFEEKKEEFDTRLNLSAEQKAKAKALREETKTKMQPLMDKIHAKRQEIQQIEQAGASKQDIKVKRDELKALFDQKRQIQEEHNQKFEAILTPEQKTEFQKMKAEIKEKRKEFKEKKKESKEQRKERRKEKRSQKEKPCPKE